MSCIGSWKIQITWCLIWDLMDIRVQTIGSFLEYEACGTADVELVFDEEARRYSTVSGESAQEVICKP